jgi:hypothetical protein
LDGPEINISLNQISFSKEAKPTIFDYNEDHRNSTLYNCQLTGVKRSSQKNFQFESLNQTKEEESFE